MARRPASKGSMRRPETAAPLLAGRRGAPDRADSQGPAEASRRIPAVAQMGPRGPGLERGLGRRRRRRQGQPSQERRRFGPQPGGSERLDGEEDAIHKLPPADDRISTVRGPRCQQGGRARFLQDRIFAKPLDDSGLWRGFEFSCQGSVQPAADWRRMGPARRSAGCAILRATKRFQRLKLLFLQLELNWPRPRTNLNLICQYNCITY